MINFDWLRAREPPPEFDREFISTRPERVAEKIHEQRANLYQFATAQTYKHTSAHNSERNSFVLSLGAPQWSTNLFVKSSNDKSNKNKDNNL